MSEVKSHQFRPPLYHQEQARNGRAAKPTPDRSKDQQGWDAYRVHDYERAAELFGQACGRGENAPMAVETVHRLVAEDLPSRTAA